MADASTLSQLADWIERPVVQNSLVALGFAALAAVVWWGRHDEQWRIAFRRFRKDRVGIASACIIALYLLIGVAETIRVPAGDGAWESGLKRLTSGIPQERSYSAPFAKIQLSKESEVAAAEASGDPAKLKSAQRYRITGTHVLGTTALGKDTLVETLRACRTALLLGGVTSVIYIIARHAARPHRRATSAGGWMT